MRTGYHRVCGTASPDGDGAVKMAPDCHLDRGARGGGILPVLTARGRRTMIGAAVARVI